MKTIDLKHPIKLANGETLKTITLTRLPTRKDFKEAQKVSTDEDDQVWVMICNLSAEKLVLEDTDALVLADVKAITEVFREFAGI